MSNIIVFDVMRGDTFVHTFKYKFEPWNMPTMDKLRAYVEDRLPTLKDKPFEIIVDKKYERYLFF